MKSKNDVNFWEPNEIVYKAGDKSASAYLVLDGSAEIISADGVKLNSFGPNELFCANAKSSYGKSFPTANPKDKTCIPRVSIECRA